MRRNPGKLLIFLVLLLPALAQAQHQTLSRISYDGTLGPARIGLTLDVSDSGALQGGHYFYAKYLKDIPLTGSLEGGKVVLHESGGDTFTLSFTGNGSEHGQPLNFNNSIGLEGLWTSQAKRLPVKLTLKEIAQAQSGERRYASVTDESDTAFEARVQGFRQAVLAGDRAAAARFIDFPLRVNHNGQSRMIRNAAQLNVEWDHIFTPQALDAIRQAVPHEMFVRNGQVMLGDGIAWFGATGAQAVNIP